MAKKNIFTKKLIGIIVTVIIIALTIFANFIIIEQGKRYIVKVYFYDKLAVAYDIGGIKGLESEIAKIKANSKLREQSAMAAEFQQKIATLSDPENFIDQALVEAKQKIDLLKNLRNAAMALILLIFLSKVFINRKPK